MADAASQTPSARPVLTVAVQTSHAAPTDSSSQTPAPVPVLPYLALRRPHRMSGGPPSRAQLRLAYTATAGRISARPKASSAPLMQTRLCSLTVLAAMRPGFARQRHHTDACRELVRCGHAACLLPPKPCTRARARAHAHAHTDKMRTRAHARAHAHAHAHAHTGKHARAASSATRPQPCGPEGPHWSCACVASWCAWPTGSRRRRRTPPCMTRMEKGAQPRRCAAMGRAEYTAATQGQRRRRFSRWFGDAQVQLFRSPTANPSPTRSPAMPTPARTPPENFGPTGSRSSAPSLDHERRLDEARPAAIPSVPSNVGRCVCRYFGGPNKILGVSFRGRLDSSLRIVVAPRTAREVVVEQYLMSSMHIGVPPRRRPAPANPIVSTADYKGSLLLRRSQRGWGSHRNDWCAFGCVGAIR
jgi:hypothetical protein